MTAVPSSSTWLAKWLKRQNSSATSPQDVPRSAAGTDLYEIPPSLSAPLSHTEHRRSGSSTPQSTQQKQPSATIFDSCRCCGTVIKYPSDVTKVRCLICHTNMTVKEDLQSPDEASSPALTEPPPLSYHSIKRKISECVSAANPNKQQNNPHVIFKPLEDMLFEAFSSHKSLNNSFKLYPNRVSNHRSPNLNFNEIRKSYSLISELPTKRPLSKLLMGALQLLKHPPIMKDTNSVNWLLILLEIPMLQDCLISGNTTSSSGLAPQFKASCYDVLKRAIGILSYADKRIIQHLTYWWSRLPYEEFIKKVDFINLYITFQLTRCINYELYNSVIQPGSYITNNAMNDDINYKETLNAHFIRPTSQSSDFGLFIGMPVYISNGGRRPPNSSSNSSFWSNKPDKKKEHDVKIKLQQYGDDWHLRTAGRLASFLFMANKNTKKVSDAIFYNNLVDYVNVRQDFDAWQFNTSTKRHQGGVETKDSLQLVVDYLQAESRASYLGISSAAGTMKKSSFTFCQFPFLLSLAAKISILEHEAKRTMERKAEEAFIQSLNKKMPFDVYFKIRVRRNNITTDSLRSIKSHQSDFKKLLRVEFVDEPGIDAGGLKKEWFLLLTKDLFNADKGLFSYDEDSNLCWFSISPIDNDELYYLVGAVLGLAIYNSTILDLRLPKAMYKKLMSQKLSLNDYIQLNPEAGHGLKRLLKLKKIEELELFFEVTYTDIFGELRTSELIENGTQIRVTDENKFQYVERYYSFFLDEVTQSSFNAFQSGFQNVIGGNALSLFTAEEIELILIGEDHGNQKIDVEILKSVTKYNGFSMGDSIVNWFWEFFADLSNLDQKKLLLFITGSDRLPATGLPSMNLKITKLVDKDTTRLPIAHTCFNELCLYEYATKEVFVSKLELAISCSEGFGLR